MYRIQIATTSWCRKGIKYAYTYFCKGPSPFEEKALSCSDAPSCSGWCMHQPSWLGCAYNAICTVPTMIKQDKKSPKLRGSAAMVRSLIPFGVFVANKLLDPLSEVEMAAIQGINHLAQCYDALSIADATWQARLRSSSILFALQYIALERYHVDGNGVAKLWRVKPKLHLFVEMCSEGTRPSMIWAYRDEDFGGSFAKYGRRRGGLMSVSGVSNGVINLFRMQPMVRIVRY